ncbi:mediator of RNA polymerase II transcription subunit 15a-like, partial [Coffea eugenioides]
LDSTAQTGNASGGDWQEEVYQKIKSMKDMYFLELNDMYMKIAGKLQQHDSLPQQPRNEQIEKLKFFKLMLERLIGFLRCTKNDIQISHKEKLASIEKQIINILSTNRPRRPVSLQQVQLAQQQMSNMQHSQPQTQIPQMQPQENQMNQQMQPMNVQSSITPMQPNSLTSLQQNTLSSVPPVSNLQQNLMSTLQPASTLDPGQSNTHPLQQVAISSLQQNTASGPQTMNINSLSSQSGMTALQSNLINALQPNSTMIHNQQLKQQEQQMLQTQQLKQQLHPRQLQQQLLQRQQLMQQQQQQQQQQLQQQPQQHQQMKPQQQPSQLPGHQMSPLHQVTDSSDLKVRPQISVKTGVFQQHHTNSQRAAYHHQQLKSGSPFPISSPQVLQAASPQVPPHASPQIDQQSMQTSIAKTGTPLQAANSPFVVPSPSTPLAPSPMPSESEKLNSGISSLSNAGNIGPSHATTVSAAAQSLAIGTPGISASPLLAEFTSLDGAHVNTSTALPCKPHTVEKPHERLIKAVQSISNKALVASVDDISSVVSMVDRIAGSAPGNGSRAAVGEDLVAMTKCRLQARNFFTQDGPTGTKKMRRSTSAMPSNVVSSVGSVNDSMRQLNSSDAFELESTATSSIRRPRNEANHALVEEIHEINRHLIDTVVDISDEDVDPIAVAAADGGEGTIVKCSFSAVALSPNLKSQYASARMSPIQPLRLLIPTNYPDSSPILLDKYPVEVSKEYEDLSIKARSKFSISLRSLSQPMSLSEMARTWDICARAVISEFAQQSGGGTFSSKYGTWENCVSAV